MGGSQASLHGYAATAALGLIALVFALPFLVPLHRYPITTFDSDWMSALLLGAALIAAGLAAPSQVPARPALFLTLLPLLAVAAIQHALGMLHYTYPLAALLLFSVGVFVAYLLGRWLVGRGARGPAMVAISAALVVGGVASVAIQWAQALDIQDLPPSLVFAMTGNLSSRRPFANLAQPNHLASFLVWGAVAALHLGRAGLAARWTNTLLAVLFCGLALTGSRLGALFALVVAALVVTPNALAPESPRSRWAALGALAAGYAAGLAATTWLLVDAHGALANAVQRFGEGSFGQRLSMWSDAWRIALAHPWLGVGVGEYGGAQYLAAEPHPSLLATNNPHNLLLHVAAEFGLPAAIALSAVVGLWCLRRTGALVRDPVGAPALVMVLVLLAHSLVEYPLWNLFFAIPVALLVALAEPAAASASGTLRARKVLAPIGVAVLATAFVMKADYDQVEAVWSAYLAEIDAGRGHAPETVIGVTGMMGSTFFRPQMERLYVELVPPEAQQGDANLELVRRSLTRLADLRVAVRCVELLVQAGDYAEARRHVARIRVFAGPVYPTLRDELLAFMAHAGPAADSVREALSAAQ